MKLTYGEAVTTTKRERLEHMRQTLHQTTEGRTFGSYFWACIDCDEQRQVNQADFVNEENS
jgi:hypothetical protein